MPTPTGIFTHKDLGDIQRLPEIYPHSEQIVHKLTNVFTRGENVIDFGAGDCFYIKRLHKHSFHVWGIDGFFPMHTELFDMLAESNFNLHMEDLSKHFEFWFIPEPGFKLFIQGQVLCLEVGEHIPEQYEQVFIDNLVRHCNSRMVLSWAVPGQNGIGHVNCRPNEYVINQITKRGFTFNETQTEYLRDNIEMHVNYFQNTLMVFDKIKE